MNEYNLLMFYDVLHEFVKHQKLIGDDNCKRLNSFLVVDDSFDFASDYVEKYKRDSFYFSRSNSEISFPALFVSEIDNPLSNYKNGAYKRDCTQIEIGVIDRWVEKCTKCTQCQKRTEQQVRKDAKTLLRKTLNEISNINLYKIDGTTFKFSIDGVIQSLKDSNKVTNADFQIKESKVLEKHWKENNPNPTIRDYSLNTSQLYGGFTIIKICDICNNNDFIYKDKNLTKETCC